MDHLEEADSAAGKGGQGIPAPHPGESQRSTPANDILEGFGTVGEAVPLVVRNKGGRPRTRPVLPKREHRGPDKRPRGRGRDVPEERKSADRQVDRVHRSEETLRRGFEMVQRRGLQELKRRTETLEKLSKLGIDDLSVVLKVCRENIAAIDGQQAPSQSQEIVTSMPFEEEGEK